jgi:hypothetical protein
MLSMNLRTTRVNTKSTSTNNLAVIGEVQLSRIEKAKQKILSTKQKKLIKQEALNELLKLRASNGGKAQYGDIPYVVNNYKKMGYSYVTRGVLCYMLSERENAPVAELHVNQLCTADASTTVSLLTGDSYEYEQENATAAVGNTNIVGANNMNLVCAKSVPFTHLGNDIITRKKSALTEAASRLKSAQDDARFLGHRCVANGTMDSIISDVVSKYSLSGLSKGSGISSNTITNRARRGNLEGIALQRMSPLKNIEPLIVEYCLQLAHIGCPLDKPQLILLASSLIQGSTYVETLKLFKESRGIKVDESNVIGKRWYLNFMRRNKDKIRRGRGKIRDVKRHTWCTYDAFKDMYASVYATMEEIGICKHVPHPVMFDINGLKVDSIEKMYGRPTNYILENPEMMIFVDETGSNTCQVSDGHVGGQLFILPSDGSSKGIIGSVSDLHFTVLPFIAGTGEAVMCAVILKSEKSIEDTPLSWRYGIDVTKTLQHQSEDDIDMFLKNTGTGTAMAGGPTCYFRGKEIPCFVCTSPKASITSKLLADMLAFIDSYHIFDRSTGKKPFLLLDGHHSRMDLPFLDYIHGEGHEWACCIGVPYATHIWQVADSPQLNGLFKVELTKIKRKFFEIKSARGRQSFEMTDIIPLVMHAWSKSFGIVENAKKAIAQRGWGPLNYVLLDHPDVRNNTRNDSVQHEHRYGDSEESSFDVSTVNTSKGFAGVMLGKIFTEHMRSTSRIEAMNEKKRKISEASRSIDKLKMLTRISSGSLAGVGQYHITSDVKDIVKEDHLIKKRKEEEKETRKKNKIEIERATYFASVMKFRSKQTLTSKDIKSMLQNHILPNDSPLCTKVKELREQFQRRQHRLHFDLTPVADVSAVESTPQLQHDNSDDNSINTDAEEQCANALFLFSQCNSSITTITSDCHDDVVEYINNKHQI